MKIIYSLSKHIRKFCLNLFKKELKNFFVTLLVLLFADVTSNAQNGTFVFKVKDAKTLQAISYASITINKDFFLSNDDGEVFIDKALAGNSLIKVTCVGYINLIDTLRNVLRTTQILLESTDIQLNDVKVQSFTTNYLTNLMIESYRKSLKENRNAVCKTRTYSIENGNKLVELTKMAQNINFSNGVLNDISVKCGDIILNTQDVNRQFRSEAITYLYLNCNPYYKRANTLFINPFLTNNASDISKYYSLKVTLIDNDLIKVLFTHKTLNNKGYIVLNTAKRTLVELSNNIYFTSNYPLATKLPNGSFTDTFSVRTTFFYNNGRWLGQSLSVNLNYKVNETVDAIQTISYIEIKDMPQYHLPITALESNSDYINILSMPVNSNMRKSILQEEDSHMIKNMLTNPTVLNSYTQLLSLDEYTKNSPELDIIQDISLVSFWKFDWELDWSKVVESTKPITNPKSKFDIFIFADFNCDSGKVEYLIEPLFNYNNSYYGPNRNETTKAFAELLFHITKVKSKELEQKLRKTIVGCPSYEVFKKEALQANKELTKELFLCKMQCNDGQNEDALIKWQTEVAEKLKKVIE